MLPEFLCLDMACGGIALCYVSSAPLPLTETHLKESCLPLSFYVPHVLMQKMDLEQINRQL